MSIIPGMLCAAPERTETSRGSRPTAERRARLPPRARPSPSGSASTTSAGSTRPADGSVAHSSVVRANAGGTGRPRRSIWRCRTPCRRARPCPVEASAVRQPHQRHAAHYTARPAAASSARVRPAGDQFLVQLEPDRVVAVDDRSGHVGGITARSSATAVRTGPVAGQPRRDGNHAIQQGAEVGVDGVDQPRDDRRVVGGVRVVVRGVEVLELQLVTTALSASLW